MSKSDPNKERLELALEAAGLDLWENDLITGAVPHKARKVLSELSYDEQEALDLMDDLFKIVHPEDLPRVKMAVDDHLAGKTEQYRCEFRLLARDGAWVWYANYGRVMDRSGETPGHRFIGVTFNIDDRKRHEEALAIRAQDWLALTENSPDIIARYDTDCRRIYANPALGSMREGGITALLGKTPTESPGGQGADLYESKLRQVLHSGEATHFELDWKNRDGESTCTHFRLTPECDAAGKVISILSVGRDITELSNYRTQLKETNAQLEDTNAMLQESNESLREAMQTIKALGGIIPVCAWCGHKIMTDQGQWVNVEQYIRTHTESEVSHGICPSCRDKMMHNRQAKPLIPPKP